jgi:hypothetical protein
MIFVVKPCIQAIGKGTIGNSKAVLDAGAYFSKKIIASL